jgi:hypothetical protein
MAWASALRSIHDTHFPAGGGVRGIDDARGRFAPFDQGQGGAYVRHVGGLGFYLRPHAEGLQGGLGIGAGGDVRGLAHGQTAVSERTRQIEARCDAERQWAFGRGDQHQPIAQQVDPALRVDGTTRGQKIHPRPIGGEVEIGRRTADNLLRQGRGRGEDRP